MKKYIIFIFVIVIVGIISSYLFLEKNREKCQEMRKKTIVSHIEQFLNKNSQETDIWNLDDLYDIEFHDRGYDSFWIKASLNNEPQVIQGLLKRLAICTDATLQGETRKLTFDRERLVVTLKKLDSELLIANSTIVSLNKYIDGEYSGFFMKEKDSPGYLLVMYKERECFIVAQHWKRPAKPVPNP